MKALNVKDMLLGKSRKESFILLHWPIHILEVLFQAELYGLSWYYGLQIYVFSNMGQYGYTTAHIQIFKKKIKESTRFKYLTTNIYDAYTNIISMLFYRCIL